MSKIVIALILSAGAGLLAYSQIGKRLGYSNTKQVWIITVSIFVLAFIILILTFSFLIHSPHSSL